jgi:hypothetical protein
MITGYFSLFGTLFHSIISRKGMHGDLYRDTLFFITGVGFRLSSSAPFKLSRERLLLNYRFKPTTW